MARFFAGVVITLIVLAILAGAFVYSGFYNIGADAPHTRFVFAMLDKLRDRSTESHASGIAVPSNLDDPKRIAAGAGLYGEMCAQCHLGPGLEKSEISQGLYPDAPELAEPSDLSPAEMFWTAKHGVKFSAMPAWGKTHNDELIWNMVAFIRQLPKMSPQQYKAAVANAPAEHEQEMKAGR
ncbi:MAG TPA: cytochrome c [Sphingomicrobium sp.]|jgi:mono/diheme cytochrome c family protein|nr:cytochrome c [Sphingomicrobium sp.]